MLWVIVRVTDCAWFMVMVMSMARVSYGWS